MTGRIPTARGALTALTRLGLFDNMLTGKMLTEFGAMAGLIFLDLAENIFIGMIPLELLRTLARLT